MATNTDIRRNKNPLTIYIAGPVMRISVEVEHHSRSARPTMRYPKIR